MMSWFTALSKTRGAIFHRVTRMVAQIRGQTPAESDWEEALISADLPLRLVMEALEEMGGQWDSAAVRAKLEESFIAVLGPSAGFSWQLKAKPTVVLIVGVNGCGKTTTAAKLAHLAKQNGLAPLLAATDTFRAAGADQLRIWADRVQCDVVAGTQGADAAAVAFDAVQAALSRKADIVFVDTAGRMHTKQPLMNELRKVRTAIGKALPNAPQEIWFVADAMIGNNAVTQAKTFHQAVPLTGLIITKLDGTAKAGCVVAVKKEIGVPVLFGGLGEGMDDLAPFDAREFVRALLGDSRSESTS